ncbi:MAG: SIS domain-containing protein [Clostridia bacterium]|nr:SIS domain-containing protein [Clostridia bacterium]
MNLLDELFQRYPALKACEKDITGALALMNEAYRSGGKILVCGNGGSCADAQHIVGELMKGFLLKRPMTAAQKNAFEEALGKEDAEAFASRLQRGIPAISLDGMNALFTAYLNDADAAYVYAQAVFGYGKPGDLLIGISTSGNSKNVVLAAKAAKALGVRTVALTGARESALSELCDVTVRVPETETFKVQELHLPVYHYLCAEMEKTFFGEEAQML